MEASIKAACLAVVCLLGLSFILGGACSALAGEAIPLEALAADFAARDQLPQSALPPAQWYGSFRRDSWGPKAATYPPVTVPAGFDPVLWKRARLATVARRLVGLPYRHHHIPAYDPPGEGRGLDCSNFTAWVYNYGLGIRFTSDVTAQAAGPKAPGRRLSPDERLAVGDLLFISTRDGSRISHVALWLGDGQLIDSHKTGVAVRPYAGWYRDCLSHVRRVVEERVEEVESGLAK